VVHLNLGYSFKYNQGVKELISPAAAQDPDAGGRVDPHGPGHRRALGILQVVKRYTRRLHAHRAVVPLLRHAPLPPRHLLILYFAFDFQSSRCRPPINSSTAWTIFTDPRAFVLPVITLSAITIASFSRYMRSSMMDALAEDYVRTARAKGASNNRVLYGHALRNALIPILTLIGLSLPPSSAAP
jgi:peptide/nickel transport system permease protein